MYIKINSVKQHKFYRLHFLEKCKSKWFWENFKTKKVYLNFLLYFFVVYEIFEKNLKIDQNDHIEVVMIFYLLARSKPKPKI